MSARPASHFERTAGDEVQLSFCFEVWAFLRDNKKWWMVPIIMVLALFGALVVMSGSAAAPFIYTLF